MKKEKDPANVQRGRRSKARSKTYELEWSKKFNTRRLDALMPGAAARRADLRYTSPAGFTYDIEVKSRISQGAGALTLYREAVDKAVDGNIPVLGLEIRRPSSNKNERLVILSREDFATIVGASEEVTDDAKN
jgi:hypothetical protein|tara:strand:+ start:2763 stop:3161 length:399 start_codon:yes stop_codon:yes gene_type:complete